MAQKNGESFKVNVSLEHSRSYASGTHIQINGEKAIITLIQCVSIKQGYIEIKGQCRFKKVSPNMPHSLGERCLID